MSVWITLRDTHDQEDHLGPFPFVQITGGWLHTEHGDQDLILAHRGRDGWVMEDDGATFSDLIITSDDPMMDRS